MALTLNLGVVSLPYTNEKGSTTTDAVAGYLENRYNVMMIYYLENEAKILDEIAESITESVDTFIQTGNILTGSAEQFAGATTMIEDGFKQFLSLGVMDGLGYPGVPTQAALNGVNNRFASRLNNKTRKALLKGIKKGDPRPSFLDTGLYMSAFRAFIS